MIHKFYIIKLWFVIQNFIYFLKNINICIFEYDPQNFKTGFKERSMLGDMTYTGHLPYTRQRGKCLDPLPCSASIVKFVRHPNIFRARLFQKVDEQGKTKYV